VVGFPSCGIREGGKLSEKKKKVRDPRRFSTEFKISGEKLIKLGAFDPILNADTALFIDPLILAQSQHAEMKAAHADWVAHFTDIIRLLSVSTGPSDVPWRQAERLFTSKEFKGTCLGYGLGIAGSGIGKELRARLMRTAYEIIQLGVKDPTLFPLLALLEKDLAADRISDLTTRVIGRRLAEFTSRILTPMKVPTQPFNFSGSMYLLPVNPLVRDRGGSPLPVVLVPTDVLRDLPIANSWQDVERISAENDALRSRVSASIGDIWAGHTLKEKERNRTIFLESRERFELLLELARAVPKRPYDMKLDPDGWASWLELGKATAANYPLQLIQRQNTTAEVVRIVEEIVTHYQHLIEHQGLWKSLYGSDGKPLHESYAQRLFFAMAIGYCEQNDLAINPESDAGGGPVDFVLSRGFHAKVVVELKLSTNRKIKHGYTKQLEKYKLGERTDEAFYVILNFGTSGGKQIDDVLKLETRARTQKAKHSRVVVIDSRRQKSASKI